MLVKAVKQEKGTSLRNVHKQFISAKLTRNFLQYQDGIRKKPREKEQ